jgi:hypothetical protein
MAGVRLEIPFSRLDRAESAPPPSISIDRIPAIRPH